MNMNFKRPLVISSLILTTALSGPVLASQLDLENTLKEQTKEDSFGKRVVTDANSDFFDGFKHRARTAYEFGLGLYNGDFSKAAHKIAAEAFEAFIIELSGDKTSHFKGGRKELDETTLKNAVNNFMDRFFEELRKIATKRKDIYGVTQSGEYVTIFDNKTVLGIFADKVMPENLPLRSVAIAALNKQIIEKAIRNQLNGLAVRFFMQLAKKNGVSVKNIGPEIMVGGVAISVKGAYDFITAESSVELPALWKYMGPRLTHYMREFMLGGLSKARDTALKQADKHVRPHFVNGIRAASSVVVPMVTYGGGMVLETVGDSIPYLGVPFSLAGRMLRSPMGLISTSGISGYVGGSYATSFYGSVEKNIVPETDLPFAKLSHKVLPLSREEYLMYGLNDEASDIERGLFAQDYADRDELLGKYFVLEMLKAIAAKGGELTGLGRVKQKLSGLFNSFKKDASLSTEDALAMTGLQQHIDQKAVDAYDTREKAYRKLLALPADERAKILEDIRKYPSYAMMISRLEGEKGDGVGKSKMDSAKQVAALKRIAEKLTEYSIDPFKVSHVEAQYELEDAVLQAVLDLSVTEQDLLVDVIGEKGVRYLESRLKSAKSPLFEDFEKKIEFKHAEIKKCLEEIVAQLVHEKNKEYLDLHQVEINLLKDHSISDGMSELYLIKIHKALSSKNEEKLKEIIGLAKKANVKADIPQQELETLKGYYIQIVAKQRAVKLVEVFDSQVEKLGILKAAKEELLKELASKEIPEANALLVSLSKKLESNSDYTELMKAIREIRDQKTIFAVELKKQFNLHRNASLMKIVEEIRKELGEKSEKVVQKKKQSSWWGSSTTEAKKPAVITGAELLEMVKKDEQTVSIFTQSEEDDVLGEWNLKEVIEVTQLEKPLGEFGEKEFMALHAKIQERKLAQFTEEGQKFFETHQGEFAQVIKTNPYYKGRIFYSLGGVVDAIRLQKKKLLASLLAEAK